jgi:hypothetical protein
MAAEGAEQLLQACENIVKGQGEYSNEKKHDFAESYALKNEVLSS